MSSVAKSRTSTPAPDGFAPAGPAERRLLEALAERYAGAGFTAWSAAADIPGELWAAAGVARPGAGWCGSWLRARKGQAHGFELTGEPDRDGVNRWRLRRMGRSPAAPVSTRELGS